MKATKKLVSGLAALTDEALDGLAAGIRDIGDGSTMVEYIGYGNPEERGGPCRVFRHAESGVAGLEHRVLHSPDGFSWGYGGSGPADLARSILWDAVGAEPAPWLTQEFKGRFVAKWPMHEGECWRISIQTVMAWVALISMQRGARILLVKGVA